MGFFKQKTNTTDLRDELRKRGISAFKSFRDFATQATAPNRQGYSSFGFAQQPIKKEVRKRMAKGRKKGRKR